MDLGSLASNASFILAAASLAGLGLQRTRVQTLRERLDEADDEAARLRATRTDDKAEIATLTADRDALGRAVRGEAELTALLDMLHEHHSKMEAHWVREEENWERYWQRGRE